MFYELSVLIKYIKIYFNMCLAQLQDANVTVYIHSWHENKRFAFVIEQQKVPSSKENS